MPTGGLPARTSILVAAARAFGSRDPDESLRNPDYLADRLIGPGELALIEDHPMSQGIRLEYSEAIQNPTLVGLAWLMLIRTRFIDEALVRAVQNGATQIVILGAGFDTRAYRFRELLSTCRVFELDAPATQEYKKHRCETAIGSAPENLTYVSTDFATDTLTETLRQAGVAQTGKIFYIWEGVSMYLSEESATNTLRALALYSPPGSSLVLDYVNHIGIELTRKSPHGPGAIPVAWGEPWVFGVPGNDGSEFFRLLGFEPAVPSTFFNPEVIKRYGSGRNGVMYGAEALAKLRSHAQNQDPPQEVLELQKAAREAGGVYWLAELLVPEL